MSGTSVLPPKTSGDSAGPPAPSFRHRSWVRRHKVTSGFVALIVLLTPVWWSLGSALRNPALGTSASARLAEWFRQHGGAPIVVWVENVWYSHHAPPVGGRPVKGAIPPTPSPASSIPRSAAPHVPVHLPAPSPITPIASPPVRGEGQWRPAGRLVEGVPAVYEADLRPDAVHTSVVVGVAWMDTDLLRATLYSGSLIPGGGPWPTTAPVGPQSAATIVAAFNSGFLLSNANGGYYTDGKTAAPLRQGAASFVVYSNGKATVGQWGWDVQMTPQVSSVRQNLDLIVDNGQPVAGLNVDDTSRWGATLGNKVYVWRSGVGVTADGALVYVGGPDLNITDLADVLARAGAARAMELDINTDWVNLATYDPPSPTGPAAPNDGTDLLPTMAATPGRYFESGWARDFFTMSLTAPPTS